MKRGREYLGYDLNENTSVIYDIYDISINITSFNIFSDIDEVLHIYMYIDSY